MAGDISRLNGKKGGRKKAQHTVAAESARAFVVGKVVENLSPLMRSKLAKALGYHVLMVPEIVTDKKGKRVRTGKFIRVTDPNEVERLMENPPGEDGEDYYVIHTTDPDPNSIQYLLNQAIGKPKETTELSGVGGGPVEFRWESDAPKKKPPVVILKR